MFGFSRRRVYMDAAAATPLAKEVVRRITEIMEIYGNPGSLHREGVAAKRVLTEARAEAARALDAHADEIVFTAGGTEANNLALMGSLKNLLAEGRPVHVITTSIEHPSILECVKELEGRGAAVEYLPVDEGGLVSVEGVRAALRDDTALVSIQYVNSEIGVVQPLRDIAKVIRDANKGRPDARRIMFHSDASQAPLYLSCRVDELHVDLMTLDGQKIMGPKGAGALYVRRGVALTPLIVGGGQEAGLRSGTENVPLVAGFSRALALSQKDWRARASRTSLLRDELITALLSEVGGASLNGSQTARIANNVNISIPGCEGEETVLRLDAKGIAASARSACSMEEGGASYVIEALGKGNDAALSSVRLTLLPHATPRDIARVTVALREVVAKMKTSPRV